MNKRQLDEGFYAAWHSQPMDNVGDAVSKFIETIPDWEKNQYLVNCKHWADSIELAGGPDHVYPMTLGFVTGAWERFIKEYEEPVENNGLEGSETNAE